ncbi:stage II sporulation protein P [Tissierella sp.]|uniref:stage II sporulation protein P n=1 Tax=Tissierella sp. TaxID=41274 RepID=UPI002863D1B6|nr:stage II sporulation protein P [Tissierella sp.]MDR7857100.1 stage II sporulation protein P [Tissierella sp.]
MKKTRKSDYIILALICMIALNIGAIAIGRYSLFKESTYSNKNDFSLVNISFNSIKESLNIKGLIDKTINIIFPKVEVDHNEDSIIATAPEFTEADENYSTENDIIIDKLEEYESLIIVKDSDGTHTVENIPEPFMINNLKVNKENPYILLYHTHATESYILKKADNYRTSDTQHNMISIGNIMSTILEANGHRVNHVDTIHDLPSYNQSYYRSLNTIKNKQEESDNLKVLLDIHRDAVLDNNKNIENIKAKSKIDIEGKSVATFSLVVGPDSPNKDQVLNFAKYIKAVSDTLYPGLCRGIIIKPTGKYNQHMSDYSALIEVGYNFNTSEESNESAKLVGEILSLALNSIIKE